MRVLPAYAGMILFAVETHEVDGGAPRVCGDDPVSYAEVPYHIMCSPRMRG